MKFTEIESAKRLLKKDIPDHMFWSLPAVSARFNALAKMVLKQNILVDVTPQNGNYIAFTDNHSIVINTGCPYISNVKERPLQYYRVLGLLAHELGHCLFTDFFLGREIYRDLTRGDFPRMLDRSRFKQETIDLPSKSPNAFAGFFQNLLNVIEDPYVEMRMSELYSGTFHTGIVYNLSDLQKDTYERLEKFANRDAKQQILNLLLGIARDCLPESFYTKYPCLLEAKKIMKRTLVRPFPDFEERANIAMEVVECIYKDFLKGNNQDVQNGQYETNFSNPDAGKQDKRNDGNLSREGEQSGNSQGRSGEQQSNKAKDGTQSDGQGEGSSGQGKGSSGDSKGEQGGKNGDSKGKQGGKQKSTTENKGAGNSGNQKTDGKNENGKQSQDSVSGDENGAGMRPDKDAECSGEGSGSPETPKVSDKDFVDFVDELFKDRASRDSLGEHLDGEFFKEELSRETHGWLHRGVELKVNKIEYNEGYKDSYYRLNEKIRSSSKACANRIRRTIMIRHRRNVNYRQKFGDEIDIEAFASRESEKDLNVFLNQTKPNKQPNMAVMTVVDCSGSMRAAVEGERFCVIDVAKTMAAVVEDFCRQLKVPNALMGHHSIHGTCTIEDCFGFEHTSKQRSNIMQLSGAACNRDGMAFKYALRKLRMRKEPLKVLIVISDGAPYAGNYGFNDALPEMHDMIKQLEKEGIAFLPFNVSPDEATAKALHRLYPNRVVDCRTMNEAVKNISEALLRESRRAYDQN